MTSKGRAKAWKCDGDVGDVAAPTSAKRHANIHTPVVNLLPHAFWRTTQKNTSMHIKMTGAAEGDSEERGEQYNIVHAAS